MDPHPKFGADVETDDVTCTHTQKHKHQEGLRSFSASIMRTLGRAGQRSGKGPKWFEGVRKVDIRLSCGLAQMWADGFSSKGRGKN